MGSMEVPMGCGAGGGAGIDALEAALPLEQAATAHERIERRSRERGASAHEEESSTR
ncbi:MAG TPA: hypothetical protein VF406_09940 [Thermodesulfobacteriota bacterium]